MTYLIERDGDEEQTEYRVEVVVHRTTEAVERNGLPPVCQGAEEELREVQHEDGDAPLLMIVIEVRTAFLADFSDSECHTSDDDW